MHMREQGVSTGMGLGNRSTYGRRELVYGKGGTWEWDLGVGVGYGDGDGDGDGDGERSKG